jgi:succinate dehydrogenase / fumarate reductase flavoprotein subunit
MMTSISGLFCSRGAGVFGEGGGTTAYLNARMGSYTLRCALDYLKTTKAPATVDYSTAVTEFKRLSGILNSTGTSTNSTSAGMRPHVIRQEIQKAAGAAFNPYRTLEGLQTAATELARIRKEDLPQQICGDRSSIYNTEWKMAIENHNLLDIAEVAINASITRQESRGFFRPDFPAIDDTNWHCMLAAQQVNGQTTYTKTTLPTISWGASGPANTAKSAKATSTSRSGFGS